MFSDLRTRVLELLPTRSSANEERADDTGN
jgi:hypothetical protein